jgi:hypothetical protein
MTLPPPVPVSDIFVSPYAPVGDIQRKLRDAQAWLAHDIATGNYEQDAYPFLATALHWAAVGAVAGHWPQQKLEITLRTVRTCVETARNMTRLYRWTV